MTGTPLTIGMMPSHPGAIMREKIRAASDGITKESNALAVSQIKLIMVINLYGHNQGYLQLH
jgi:hypothetical protein